MDTDMYTIAEDFIVNRMVNLEGGELWNYENYEIMMAFVVQLPSHVQLFGRIYGKRWRLWLGSWDF